MEARTQNVVDEYPREFPQLCRYLSERSPQPMVAVEGPTHLVRYANPAFMKLLAAPGTSLIGRPFVEAIPERVANQCAAMLDRVYATGRSESLPEQEHSPAIADAGEPRHWSYLAWAIRGPADHGGGKETGEKTVGIMIQVTDSTAVATYRRQAIAVNEALLLSGIRQHELIARAEELSVLLRESETHEREARLDAVSANDSKDVFLATLSHEMRTPLNAILGWAVLLREEAARKGVALDDDLSQGLGVIERNARAQGKLIEEVLDVSRVISGKFSIDPRPCDLAVLTLTTVQAVRPAAAAKGLSLTVAGCEELHPGELCVFGDAPRLQQVLSNLLTNAIKFTPSGGVVTVGLQRHESSVRLVVRDNGIGISTLFLPHVFDRFRQADEGTTRVYGGLGLGLSIVLHIVELHHGTVHVHSEGQGRGTTFTVELPLQTQSPPFQTAANAEKAPSLRGVRVLVIDDETDARTLTMLTLQSAGATVIPSASAEEGFALIRGAVPPFDVLVCDIGMPHEDGYSLLARLRDAGVSAESLPALALTAYAAAKDKHRAILAGFQVHVPKPVSPLELTSIVAKLAGRTLV